VVECLRRNDRLVRRQGRRDGVFSARGACRRDEPLTTRTKNWSEMERPRAPAGAGREGAAAQESGGIEMASTGSFRFRSRITGRQSTSVLVVAGAVSSGARCPSAGMAGLAACRGSSSSLRISKPPLPCRLLRCMQVSRSVSQLADCW
jgi:hypothetical protein